MSVSLVVPTVGVSDHLRRSVENMIESAARVGPDAEVLVVVNGAPSVPALRTVRSSALRVLHLEHRNLSRARNVGIEQARHDTVIFGDDGAEMPVTWCEDLAGALRDERFPVVTAPVRVPVSGPITSYLNYQRVFDPAPITATEVGSVTGALGIRRDRLPATIRYDEENLPEVGEDTAFGLALRQAGIPIRWLDVTPARHLLPERVEEITQRAFRYGGGAARVSCRRLGPVPGPDDVLTFFRILVLGDYRGFRRFSEVLAPGLRSAFTLFDFLYNVSWLVGYLDEAGRELGRAIVDVDRDGLRPALRDLATSAGARVEDGAWNATAVDFRRLGPSGAADPFVAQARWLLTRHVTLRAPRAPRPDDQQQPAPVGAAPGKAAFAPGGEPPPPGSRRRAGGRPRRRPDDRLTGLLAAWRQVRATGAPIDADAVDRMARELGFGFRQACEAIEQSA